MAVSSSEQTNPPPEPAAVDTGVLDRRLGAALAVLNGVFLAVLGFVAGIVLGVSAAWLSWLWLTGTVGQVLGVVTVLLLLAVLFLGGRAIGWATGARWGPGAFAAGWVLANFALTGYVSGGDVMVASTVPNHLLLYGGVGAVVLATVRTPAEPVTRGGRTPSPSRGRAGPR